MAKRLLLWASQPLSSTLPLCHRGQNLTELILSWSMDIEGLPHLAVEAELQQRSMLLLHHVQGCRVARRKSLS